MRRILYALAGLVEAVFTALVWWPIDLLGRRWPWLGQLFLVGVAATLGYLALRQ